MAEPVRKIGVVDGNCVVVVGVHYGSVTIWTGQQPAVLVAADRDRFSRLYFEAERQAEAWQREHPS